MSNSELREFYGRVLDVLESKLWIQQALARLESREGMQVDVMDFDVQEEDPIGVCLVGAINYVEQCDAIRWDATVEPIFGNYTPTALAIQAQELLAKCINTGRATVSHQSLPSWNDEPGRTREHVVALVRAAQEAVK